jgi:hypothetical protein
VKSLLLTRTTLIWALLVAATVMSWRLGHGIGPGAARAAGPAILVIAFIKVRFVVLEFMEIRAAPLWLRLALQGWMVMCCALLMGLLGEIRAHAWAKERGDAISASAIERPIPMHALGG